MDSLSRISNALGVPLYADEYITNYAQDIVQLWEDLRLVVENAQMPTLCMGDFNAMLNETDRLNGSPVQEGEIKDFVDFLPDTHMTDLKKNGSDYTWTNGHTCCRIDRAIVNAEWMTHVNAGGYDTNPMDIRLFSLKPGIGCGDLKLIKCLQSCFQLFSQTSGLVANAGKSNVYFGGVKQALQDQIFQELHFTKGDIPFRYLGVPLSTKRLSVVQCKTLVDKMLGRLRSGLNFRNFCFTGLNPRLIDNLSDIISVLNSAMSS
ncbi:hypothetical protein BC332_27889 [Capsicum chinense]|nr:hypothetical protein BC332_27889 [Capsicum chinense]